MFKEDCIQYECVITPPELNDNINTVMLKQAQAFLLNKCTSFGFIKQIFKIKTKSEGLINIEGSIIYKVWIDVLVCNPEIGDEIECEVTDNDDRIGKPIMKNHPLLVVIFSENEHEIGEKLVGIITDKRIDKTNNMINLLVDIKDN